MCHKGHQSVAIILLIFYLTPTPHPSIKRQRQTRAQRRELMQMKVGDRLSSRDKIGSIQSMDDISRTAQTLRKFQQCTTPHQPWGRAYWGSRASLPIITPSQMEKERKGGGGGRKETGREAIQTSRSSSRISIYRRCPTSHTGSQKATIGLKYIFESYPSSDSVSEAGGKQSKKPIKISICNSRSIAPLSDAIKA